MSMSEEKKGFFKRLVSGLTKTRDNIVAGFDSTVSKSRCGLTVQNMSLKTANP